MKAEQACRFRAQQGYGITARSAGITADDDRAMEFFSDVMNPLFPESGSSVITGAKSGDDFLIGKSTMRSDVNGRQAIFTNAYVVKAEAYYKIMLANPAFLLALPIEQLRTMDESISVLPSVEIDDTATPESIDELRDEYQLSDCCRYGALLRLAYRALLGNSTFSIETAGDFQHTERTIRSVVACIAEGVLPSLLCNLTFSSGHDLRVKICVKSGGRSIGSGKELSFPLDHPGAKIESHDDDLTVSVFDEIAQADHGIRAMRLAAMDEWLGQICGTTSRVSLPLVVCSYCLTSGRVITGKEVQTILDTLLAFMRGNVVQNKNLLAQEFTRLLSILQREGTCPSRLLPEIAAFACEQNDAKLIGLSLALQSDMSVDDQLHQLVSLFDGSETIFRTQYMRHLMPLLDLSVCQAYPSESLSMIHHCVEYRLDDLCPCCEDILANVLEPETADDEIWKEASDIVTAIAEQRADGERMVDGFEELSALIVREFVGQRLGRQSDDKELLQLLSGFDSEDASPFGRLVCKYIHTEESPLCIKLWGTYFSSRCNMCGSLDELESLLNSEDDSFISKSENELIGIWEKLLQEDRGWTDESLDSRRLLWEKEENRVGKSSLSRDAKDALSHHVTEAFKQTLSVDDILALERDSKRGVKTDEVTYWGNDADIRRMIYCWHEVLNDPENLRVIDCFVKNAATLRRDKPLSEEDVLRLLLEEGSFSWGLVARACTSDKRGKPLDERRVVEMLSTLSAQSDPGNITAACKRCPLTKSRAFEQLLQIEQPLRRRAKHIISREDSELLRVLIRAFDNQEKKPIEGARQSETKAKSSSHSMQQHVRDSRFSREQRPHSESDASQAPTDIDGEESGMDVGKVQFHNADSAEEKKPFSAFLDRLPFGKKGGGGNHSR